MVDPKIRPSMWYYGLAILVIVAGGALFAWSIFSGISDIEKGLTQVVVPGASDLDLEEVGDYTIFYENESYVDGKIYSTGEDLPEIDVEVKEKSSGEAVDVYPLSVSSSYNIGSRSGRSMLGFEIDHPGVYLISAAYPEGREGPDIVLAVGHNAMGGIFSTVMTSLLALFGSMIIAVAIVIAVYLKRKKAAEMIEESKRQEDRLMGR